MGERDAVVSDEPEAPPSDADDRDGVSSGSDAVVGDFGVVWLGALASFDDRRRRKREAMSSARCIWLIS